MGARSFHGGRRAVRPGAWVLAAAMLSSSWAGAAWAAEGRVALVIGNAAYERVAKLANPGNDARAVGDAFERLGYAVTRLEDAGFDALRRGLLDFTRAASASEVAVVFYAGHGIEVDGRNFLVPVDAALTRDADGERTTGGSQTPIEYGKLPDADIYLASGPGPIVGGGTTAAPPSLGPARAYEAAERVGTVAAFQAFIERYPHGYEATLAKEQIAKLEREADDAAFARAKRLHTESGYHGYLSSYPSGRHASEARALLAEVTKPPEWAPGKRFRDCPECPELVVVPSGSFMMGSPESELGRDDDEDLHPVTITRPFAVGVTEVTFGEWDACVSGGGCGGYRPDDAGWGRGRRPVINVSWDDAKSHVRWLSRETGEGYRLLSESEWEYVARAGAETQYWWGNGIGRNRANCDGCGSRWDDEKTASVGSFSANAWGLHDVLGNVWEWVEDCWNEGYHGAPRDGSAWESGNCGSRVLRGGSWFSVPGDLRSAYRSRSSTGSRGSNAGFRVARTLD